MTWSFNKTTPVFLQIVSKIKSDIVTGTYKPDEQIPPVRQLAQEASVNPNTMQRALSELESYGLLVTRGTVGRFVTSDVNLLEKAKNDIKAEALENLLTEAKSLGITNQEIITYLENHTQGGTDS